MDKNIELLRPELRQSYIDYRKILSDIIKNKKLYFIILPLIFFISAFYSLTMSDYYTCDVKMALVLSINKDAGNLRNLAKTFGSTNEFWNLRTDALYPEIYPELMSSMEFRATLFDIMVKDSEGNEYPYYQYLQTRRDTSPLSSVISKIWGSKEVKKPKETIEKMDEINPFKLTPIQQDVSKVIAMNVSLALDKEFFLFTISATDQDPYVAATLADGVKDRLQTFIRKYHTNKAQNDYEFYEKMRLKAKQRYDKARIKFAEYSDSHREINTEKATQVLISLEEEMNLHFNEYTQYASQVINARAKIQEEKSVFTILQQATIPSVKAGPARAEMCVQYVLLVLFLITLYIFFKEGDIRNFFGMP